MADRLISADALIAEMHNVILEDGEDRRTFYAVIERQPTIDAVEVVRCKDCLWRVEMPHRAPLCARLVARHIEEDDFCSWGER